MDGGCLAWCFWWCNLDFAFGLEIRRGDQSLLLLYGVPALIADKRLYRLERNAHVGAEFFDGDQLVIAFIEVDPDLDEEISAVALTFPRDALDVFGVDTKPDESGFHGCFFSLPKFIKRCGIFAVGIRYNEI